MPLRWVSANPKTGVVNEELPSLRLESSLSGFIGQGERAKVSLPINDRLPPNWRYATEPWRTVLVCHYDDAEHTILWVGIIARREWGSGPHIKLDLIPVEEWLKSQLVGNLDYSKSVYEQTHMMRNIGLNRVTYSFNGGVTEEPTGIMRTAKYSSISGVNCLSAMQALMSMVNGPEFSIRWRWSSEGRLFCNPYVGMRVGRPAPPGRPAPFTIGAGAEWTRARDWSQGKGANSITVLEPKIIKTTMVVQKKVDPKTKKTVTTRVPKEETYEAVYTLRDQQAINGGYLPSEVFLSPNYGTTDSVSAATALAMAKPYASRAMKEMRYGNSELDVKIHVDDLILGSDELWLGDDITLDLDNPDLEEINERSVQRMVGWTIDADPVSGEPTTFTPIMLSNPEEDVVFDNV